MTFQRRDAATNQAHQRLQHGHGLACPPSEGPEQLVASLVLSLGLPLACQSLYACCNWSTLPLENMILGLPDTASRMCVLGLAMTGGTKD